MHAKAAEEDKITNNIFRKYVYFTRVHVVALILRIVEYVLCCKCQCNASVLSNSEHLC